jgi:16S rRNA (guanine527-N7)-methyltransferase
MTPTQQLGAGLAALGLSLPARAAEQLIGYLDLLKKWNKVYNLTAIRDTAEMVTQHLLDSLAVLPYLPQVSTLADIGSGAGLPGIPLAIARSETQVVLVEAVNKKASFLQQVKIELDLVNVSIHCGRVEEWVVGSGFDAVISRAFSDLAQFVRLAGGLVGPAGRMYAMKGAYPDAEIAAVPPPWRIAGAPVLKVPGSSGQRHLIILERH